MNDPSIDNYNSGLRAVLMEEEEIRIRSMQTVLANRLAPPLFLDRGHHLFAKKKKPRSSTLNVPSPSPRISAFN